MLHQCDEFGECRLPDGRLAATFHIEFVDKLDIPDINSGRPFHIFHPMGCEPTSERVIGGFLNIDPDRAQFFGGLPAGERATLISIIPEFCLSSKQFIVVNLTDTIGALVRHPPSVEVPVIMDICSGIHGWTVGGRPFGFRPTIAVEIDESIAELGRLNFGHWLVTPERMAGANHAEVRRWLERGVTIVGDFKDQLFWERVSCDGVHVFVVSLPCPPWSELARARGLDDIRGSLFFHLRFMANVFRPIAVVFENVRGMLIHPDWDCIRKMFCDVGFVVAHESVDPLSHVLPMTRERASVIMLNVMYADQLISMQIKPTPTPLLLLDPNPRAKGAFHDVIPQVIKPLVGIHPQDEELLVDFRMWPKDWKLKHPMVDHHTIDIQERVINRTKPLPCPVAKYTMPHHIDVKLLCDKGLYMKVVNDPCDKSFRWLSPCEIQCGLGFPWNFILKRDPSLTYHVLGNTISPIHAALSIARLATVYPQVAPVTADIFRVLMQLVSDVPKLPAAIVEFDEEHFWLVPKMTHESNLVIQNAPNEQSQGQKRSLTGNCNGLVKRHRTSNDSDIEGVAVEFDPYMSQDCVNEETCQNQQPLVEKPLRLKFAFTNICGEFFEWDAEGDGPFAMSEGDHFRFSPPDVWISGFHTRELVSTFPQNAVSLSNPEETTVMDLLGTWTCHVSKGNFKTVGEVISSADHSIQQCHCQNIAANHEHVDWNSPYDTTINVIKIQFRKVKKVIHLSGTRQICVCYCDPIDTVYSLCSEHPIFRSTDDQHLVSVEHAPIASLNGTLSMIRLGPHDKILKHPNFVWTLVTIGFALPDASTDHPEHPQCVPTQLDALTVHDSCDEEESNKSGKAYDRSNRPALTNRTKPATIGVIHPLTGKYFELPVELDVCVIHLLDLLSPPVASDYPCVAEINGKQINLQQTVAGLDHSCTIRFRHYCLPGGAPPVADCLKTELAARGVPPEQIQNRITAVLTTVGTKPIEDAFLTEDPWAKIKQTCSSKSVRLILPGELKSHQANRRANSIGERSQRSASASAFKGKKGVGKGKSKSKGKLNDSNSRSIPLPSWNEVDLPEGFVATDDSPLDYIDVGALQKDATGVCPVSFHDAEPYMTNNSKLSDDPLALVIPGHHFSPGDDINHIALPVSLCCDGSPMLMPATLYQLGNQHVYFSFRGPTAEIETTPSTVIEIQINSESCPFWKSISKPLDILVQGAPLLRDRDVLLSHWSWKWLDDRKMVSPEKASRLHGYLRVPDTALEKLLAISGPNGISMWPKSESKVLDPRYSHIGVEARGPDEVCAIAKATNHTLGFVQSVSGKWLVRCRREHYPATRAKLIPSGLVLEDIPIGQFDTQYILQACTADLSCTSHAINTGLSELGWNAKVVKSMGPSAWLVTAKEFPPHQHISLSGKIMSVKQFDGNRTPFVNFASSHQSGMNQSAGNPWQNYVPTNVKDHPIAPPGPGPTASRFNELEKSLHAKLDERLAVMENKITKVSQESSKATSGCLQKIDNLEQCVTTKFMSVENTIASGQQQLISQMKQLFESYAPCNEEPAKRPRKSDPPQPKE